MKRSSIGKLNIKKWIIPLMLVAIFAALIATGTTYADLIFTIDTDYSATAATNYFTIGSSGNYYGTQDIQANQSGYTVNVKNNVVNPNAPNSAFDLLVYTTSGVTVTNSAAQSTVHYSINGGECYVFSNITHSSPSATATMPVTIFASNIRFASTIKTVVLKHSDNNEYVDSFFALKMLNNETYHNPSYVNAFGDWTTASSGTYTVSGNDIEMLGMGTVYDYTTPAQTLSSLAGTVSDDMSELAFSVNRLVTEFGVTIAGGHNFDFVVDADGWYYNTNFGLRMSLSEGVVTLQILKYVTVPEYCNVYFINDVTIDTDFELTIPAYINFLYAKLTLEADFTITHNYGGAFTIEAIPTSNVIINNAHTLSIDAPFAYYTTESGTSDGYSWNGVSALVTTPTNLVKTSDNVDFAAQGNEALLAALMDDALSYIDGYIPSKVSTRIVLPSQYCHYNVTYDYSSSNTSVFSNEGSVTRASSDTAITFTISVSFNGVVQDTLTKTITVIGTSETSEMTALYDTLSGYVAENDLAVNGVSFFNVPMEIYALFCNVNEAVGLARCALATNGTLKMEVGYLNNGVEATLTAYKAEFDFEGGYVYLSDDSDSVIATVATSDMLFIYLDEPTILLVDANDALTLSYAYSAGEYLSSSDITLNVLGMTFEEKTAYIERYIESVYIMDAGATQRTLRLSQSGFYLGSTEDDNCVIGNTLGATDIAYSFYTVSTVDYNTYKAGVLTLAQLIADSDTAAVTTFAVNDGYVTGAEISLDAAQSLIMCVSITFDSEIASEQSYVATRIVNLPSGGIGGNEYLEYVRGSTFGEYFGSLTNGMLIDSTTTLNNPDGTAFTFTTDNVNVYMSLTIVNANEMLNGATEFCRIVTLSNERSYQIDINVEAIPNYNSTVMLLVVFYMKINNENVSISEQDYSFVIPGIYRQGTDVADANVYARMLQVYENFDGYLLVDGARASVASFDCSLDTLNAIEGVSLTAADSVSIDGIQLLANTAGMVFDGLNIASLAPFSEFESYNLTSLSMNDCGITGTAAIAVTNGTPNLYYLNKLTSISLNGNALTSLADANGNCILYRTLRSLSVADQTDGSIRTFDDLSGIDDLPQLNVLDVSGNAIADFDKLDDCKQLTSVTLSDNVCSEFATKTQGDENVYYGTRGVVNIPIYVSLVDKGVTVIGDEAETYSTALQIETYRLPSLALNAIISAYTQYTSISFPTLTYVRSTGSASSYAINVVYVVRDLTVLTYTTSAVDSERTSISSSSFADGDVIKIIASITVGGNTAYGQFEFLYKEVTA